MAYRITAGEREAWFCGDDEAALAEMVDELFPGRDDVVVEHVDT